MIAVSAIACASLDPELGILSLRGAAICRALAKIHSDAFPSYVSRILHDDTILLLPHIHDTNTTLGAEGWTMRRMEQIGFPRKKKSDLIGDLLSCWHHPSSCRESRFQIERAAMFSEHPFSFYTSDRSHSLQTCACIRDG